MVQVREPLLTRGYLMKKLPCILMLLLTGSMHGQQRFYPDDPCRRNPHHSNSRPASIVS